ncbi:MAG: ankyrin repeat domain-containing protein [Candidatus Micrarchaeota archaeon]|nr:ankyrin repeat domain-containing protein [Candidatus Micrarchaeota archaeon]
MELKNAGHGRSGNRKTLRRMPEIAESDRKVASEIRQGKLNSDLMEAARLGKEVKVEWLIKKGAEIDSKDRDGTTPLMEAAKFGHAGICSILIDSCAKAKGDIKKLIASKDKMELTPLHIAAWRGNPRICAIMIAEYAKAGGNAKELMDMKNIGGDKPMQLVQRSGYRPSSVKTAQFLGSIESLADVIDGEALAMFMESFRECASQ